MEKTTAKEPAKTSAVTQPGVNRLLGILQRIKRGEDMCKEDADELLCGGIILNYRFLRSETGKPHDDIKDILVSRIHDVMSEMA